MLSTTTSGGQYTKEDRARDSETTDQASPGSRKVGFKGKVTDLTN